jgi:nucleoside 2-deoxyribosyltransferase
MVRMTRAYLAGPEVFLPDAVALGQRKKALCAAHGILGLYPLDNTPGASGPLPLDSLIYRANVAMIRDADCGILNLTPFRGVSADVGTVFELGMLVGLGKPVFAYTNESADLLDRVRLAHPLTFDTAEGLWRDAAGMMVEDFGNADNLMIDAALREGASLLVRHVAAPEHLFHDLTGFEMCLRLARDSTDRLSRAVA